MSLIRLNKYLAQCGITSRRSADKLIQEGKVKVNDLIVNDLGTKIDSNKDHVFVDNKEIRLEEQYVYYLLNKPKGYITTSNDPQHRKSVIDLVPEKPRVFSIGRLDKDTGGLLILTNDGELAYKLSHPKFEKEKEYKVKANFKFQISNFKFSSAVKCLAQGVKLEKGIAKADKIEMLSQKGETIEFKIVIHQGWKRQIRRMCDKIGLKVVDLKRVRIGNLKLGNLKEGTWRKLQKEEIEK